MVCGIRHSLHPEKVTLQLQVLEKLTKLPHERIPRENMYFEIEIQDNGYGDTLNAAKKRLKRVTVQEKWRKEFHSQYFNGEMHETYC